MTIITTTKYVNIETGQLLTAKEAKKHYLILKTKKHANINRQHGKCNIEYTKLCRKNPQQELFD